MPHAPRSPTNCAGMQTKLSAWTPLNHPVSNSKVFEAADFTCQLPRALCLYIFSFLDPRSLCRSAQVSWHWKSIVELDQLWRPKCLRLGWYVTSLEQGVWKRHYIQSVQELKAAVIPDASVSISRHEGLPEAALLTEERPASSLRFSLIKDKQPATLPPWRDSDRRPKDTLRLNYLDNHEPVKHAPRALTNSAATTCRGNRKSLSEATYKLRKAKSLMFLSSNCRPQNPPPPQQAPCGIHPPITKEAASSLLGLAPWNAGVRPGPVRSAVPRLSVEALRASQRSHRSSPSAPLFDYVPASHAR